jgi:hypothetical protein
MNRKQVPSNDRNKDEDLSYLEKFSGEFKQDILNQCVNYMIHFGGDTIISSDKQTPEQIAENRKEFDEKTQESINILSRLLPTYTEEQLEMFIQELEGKTDPYAEPDEIYDLPDELSALVTEASQLYQARQTKIIEEFKKSFDK